MKISIDGIERQLLLKLLAKHIVEREANGEEVVLNAWENDSAIALFDRLQPEGVPSEAEVADFIEYKSEGRQFEMITDFSDFYSEVIVVPAERLQISDMNSAETLSKTVDPRPEESFCAADEYDQFRDDWFAKNDPLRFEHPCETEDESPEDYTEENDECIHLKHQEIFWPAKLSVDTIYETPIPWFHNPSCEGNHTNLKLVS